VLVIVRDVTFPLAKSQGNETAVPLATGAELGRVTSVSAMARFSIREFLNLHVVIQRVQAASPLLAVHICSNVSWDAVNRGTDVHNRNGSNVVQDRVNKEADVLISDIYRTL
jgi:hypothetical protein